MKLCLFVVAYFVVQISALPLKLDVEKQGFNGNTLLQHSCSKMAHLKKSYDPKKRLDSKKPNTNVTECLYQGDIILTPEQMDQVLSRSQGSDLRAEYSKSAMNPSYYKNSLWKDVVPYYFDNTVDTKSRSKIQKAIEYWQNYTCLTFIEDRKYPDTKIHFTTAEYDCYSMVGKMWQSNFQIVNLGWCRYEIGVIGHEIGHALGLFHTQERWDRDLYVVILYHHIPLGWWSEFTHLNMLENENFGLPYDYGSIMHYNGGPSRRLQMLAIEPFYQGTLGGNIWPSFVDVKLVNEFQKCTCKTAKVECRNGGYPHPKNCSMCICPWGLGGQDCTERSDEFGCGEVLNATQQWQTLNGTFTLGQLHDTAKSCFWHIKAPEKRLLQIRVLDVYGIGYDGCAHNGIELKLVRNMFTTITDFSRTGRRFCSEYKPPKTYIFYSFELAIVHAFYRKTVEFELEYRYSLE